MPVVVDDIATIAALAGSAAKLVGSLTGAKANNNLAETQLSMQNFWNQAQYDFAERQYNESKWQFRRAQKHTIRDRVADAKAAGIHPLYALGISPSGGSVAGSFMPGQSPVGSVFESNSRDVANAVAEGAAAFGERQARKEAAELMALEKRLKLAQIGLAESQARAQDAETLAALSASKTAAQDGLRPRVSVGLPTTAGQYTKDGYVHTVTGQGTHRRSSKYATRSEMEEQLPEWKTELSMTLDYWADELRKGRENAARVLNKLRNPSWLNKYVR